MDQHDGRDHGSHGLHSAGADHRSEACRDLRAIVAFDQADDAARDLAAIFERVQRTGGELGAAFLGATGAGHRLADALGAVADVLRDEHAAASRARRGSLARDYIADVLGPTDDTVRREFLDQYAPSEPTVGGPAVTPGTEAWRREREGRWIWPRQLSIDVGPDQADAHPEQHDPRCPALAGLDCDRGCPDGQRWNAERARRTAILDAPDEQPTG
jgi:hypothetical protein